jgi:uncharacterized membrane protein
VIRSRLLSTLHNKPVRNLWLASGGAYLILGVAWLLAAILFVVFAIRTGSARNDEGGGCAVAIGSIVTMSVGGGIGLQIGPYPWFMLTALGLGLLFPGLMFAFWLRKR